MNQGWKVDILRSYYVAMVMLSSLSCNNFIVVHWKVSTWNFEYYPIMTRCCSYTRGMILKALFLELCPIVYFKQTSIIITRNALGFFLYDGEMSDFIITSKFQHSILLVYVNFFISWQWRMRNEFSSAFVQQFNYSYWSHMALTSCCESWH
jgi:hypothetical protein